MAENFGLLTKNDFWIEDPRLGVLLKNCLFFGRFQPGVAYKSVAYKKKRVGHESLETTDAPPQFKG